MSSRRPTADVTIRDPLALCIECGDTVVIVEEFDGEGYVWRATLKTRDLTTDRTYQRRKVWQDYFAAGLRLALNGLDPPPRRRETA